MAGTGKYITEVNHPTVDQELKVAEVAALLVIAQEISALNPQNTMSRDDKGCEINGWGMVTRKAKRSLLTISQMKCPTLAGGGALLAGWSSCRSSWGSPGITGCP
jgi:hypothetical protein